MLRKKLLLRRLAYVPWLLAVCLVLGWSGEAVADPESDATRTNHGGDDGDNHRHATDPYLRLSVKLDPEGVAGTSTDSVIVHWSTSYAKNFHTGNGEEAESYILTLVRGEIPSDITGSPTPVGSALTFEAETGATSFRLRRAALPFNSGDANVATGGTGFYWVRMDVGPDDEDGGPIRTFFAKQIAIKPDYILSVNPSSVREDAGATDIEVKVKVGDDTAVEQNTPVPPLTLGANQSGFNSRFGISFPPLVISEGEKEVTGTIRFTPIASDTPPHDDLLVTIKTFVAAGATDAVAGATDIRLVDTDKTSTAISLSFSDATITKNDGATEIEVTATLDGKTLDDHVSFDLTIDNAGADGTDYREARCRLYCDAETDNHSTAPGVGDGDDYHHPPERRRRHYSVDAC